MSFKILTLGCKVNTYESNVMRELLLKEGYKEVSHKEPADIVIINTCSVTNMADNKSKKVIRHEKRNIRENPFVTATEKPETIAVSGFSFAGGRI